jgi:protocatechuate 3,4-dioxygenase alpha subunit
MALGRTPSQTVGPYFAMRLSGEGHDALLPASDPRCIRVVGRVDDTDRHPIDDALVEIWQANAFGRYRHPADGRTTTPLVPGFGGFGRATIDPNTLDYSFLTVKPGRVPAPDGRVQAPHIAVIVQARGMLRPLYTRLYFDDEPAANEEDLVLLSIPAERRRTLVAASVPAATTPTYRFDVRLGGDDETVFFDL